MNKLKYILALFITPILLCADYPGYHTANSLNTKLTNYALTYPNICSLEPFGTSTNGRTIYGLKISDNPTITENEPKLHISGSIHGNEPIGMEICVELIDHLIQNYGSDSQVKKHIDNSEIFIFPLLNPDGLANNDRENSNNIDLNRDFPDGVINNIGNLYDNTTVNYYDAQQETQNIIDWHINNITTLNVNIHSGSVTVVYPYGNYPNAYGTKYAASPDDALYIDICQEYADLNSRITNNHSTTNPIINGANWYPVIGEMPDWVYRYTGSLAITIEVSMNKAPSSSLINTHWLENKASLLAMIDRNSNALHGAVTDSATDQPIKARITFVGTDGNEFYTNSLGQYNRILAPGSYRLKVEAEDYHPLYQDVMIKENDPLMQNIKMTKDNVIITVIDGANDQFLDATITVMNEVSPLFSNLDSGSYSKTLAPGTYQVKIEAANYQSQIQQLTITSDTFHSKTVALNQNKLQLIEGWNLVSVPTNAMVELDALIWTWNTEDQNYKAWQVSQAANRTFWVYSTEVGELQVSYDSLYPSSELLLNIGWNMVGPDTKFILNNGFYAYYYDDYYKTTSILRAYQGYWLFSLTPQAITVD